jgi:DMSO/TMAO reductase YedYZ heme-binding membrane subunit
MTAAVVTPTSPLWYTTRATGLVALVLLTASVVLGVLTSVRFARPRWPRFVTIGLHRNMSLLVLTFVVLHVVTTVTDPFASIHWLDAVVPFASSYRGLWLGLGTIGFDLLIALTVTSLLRVHLSHRTWRLVHWLAYVCWPVAVLHGLGTGTDTAVSWVLGVTVLCVAAVVAALAWRLSAGWPRYPAARVAASAGVLIALVGSGAWLAGGPLKPGWARRSGTPPALLAHSATGAKPAASPAQGTGSAGGASLPAVPFHAPLSGTASQSQAASGDVTVTIAGATTGSGGRAALGILITGVPDGSGGVSMTSSQVSFGPAAAPRRYTGRLTALNGTSMRATVRTSAAAGGSGSAPQTLSLNVALSVNGSAVSGTVSVSSGGGTNGAGGQ